MLDIIAQIQAAALVTELLTDRAQSGEEFTALEIQQHLEQSPLLHNNPNVNIRNIEGMLHDIENHADGIIVERTGYKNRQGQTLYRAGMPWQQANTPEYTPMATTEIEINPNLLFVEADSAPGFATAAEDDIELMVQDFLGHLRDAQDTLDTLVLEDDDRFYHDVLSRISYDLDKLEAFVSSRLTNTL